MLTPCGILVQLRVPSTFHLFISQITIMMIIRFVEHTSAVNVKRTWVDFGLSRDWMDDNQGQGDEFLYHATQVLM